jgi:hypothetical protein
MVTFLVVIARQRLAPAEARSSRSRRNSQLVSFHQLPHSSKLRIARNSRPLNHFPTLCRKYRGCTPPWECGSSLPLFLPAPMSAPSDIADNCQRAAHSALFPAVFCTFLHCPKSHPLLFQQLPHSLQKNTGGGACACAGLPSTRHRAASPRTPRLCARIVAFGFLRLSTVSCRLPTRPSLMPRRDDGVERAARSGRAAPRGAARQVRRQTSADRWGGKRTASAPGTATAPARPPGPRRRLEPLPQHQPQNVLRLRAQRQPNAAFVRAHEFTKTFAERGKPRAC